MHVCVCVNVHDVQLYCNTHTLTPTNTRAVEIVSSVNNTIVALWHTDAAAQTCDVIDCLTFFMEISRRRASVHAQLYIF